MKRKILWFPFIYFLTCWKLPRQDGETIHAAPLPSACEVYLEGRQNSPHLKAGETKVEKYMGLALVGYLMVTSLELFFTVPVTPWHSSLSLEHALLCMPRYTKAQT